MGSGTDGCPGVFLTCNALLLSVNVNLECCYAQLRLLLDGLTPSEYDNGLKPERTKSQSKRLLSARLL